MSQHSDPGPLSAPAIDSLQLSASPWGKKETNLNIETHRFNILFHTLTLGTVCMTLCWILGVINISSYIRMFFLTGALICASWQSRLWMREASRCWLCGGQNVPARQKGLCGHFWKLSTVHILLCLSFINRQRTHNTSVCLLKHGKSTQPH